MYNTSIILMLSIMQVDFIDIVKRRSDNIVSYIASCETNEKFKQLVQEFHSILNDIDSQSWEIQSNMMEFRFKIIAAIINFDKMVNYKSDCAIKSSPKYVTDICDEICSVLEAWAKYKPETKEFQTRISELYRRTNIIDINNIDRNSRDTILQFEFIVRFVDEIHRPESNWELI